MRVPQRSAATVILALVCMAASAALAAVEIRVSFDGKTPGQSVVGLGTVHPLLNINDSGGNDVIAIKEGVSPPAFGANKDGVLNVANACIGSPDSSLGFADLGAPPTYIPSTKKHQYTFTFAPDTAVKEFSLRMRDWGDFLPNGANASGRYAMNLAAYNANGELVDTDQIVFTSTSSAPTHRPSAEFGDLFVSGDACTALEGQPGNYVFHVSAPGITRVTVNPADAPSIDPHIGFNDLRFTLDLPDSDGDGVPDPDDRCPDSVTAAESPRVVVGVTATSVANVNNVDGHGCSIQDLVNEIAASSKNHGHFVTGIDALTDWLLRNGYVTRAQARELHLAAAHKK